MVAEDDRSVTVLRDALETRITENRFTLLKREWARDGISSPFDPLSFVKGSKGGGTEFVVRLLRMQRNCKAFVL